METSREGAGRQVAVGGSAPSIRVRLTNPQGRVYELSQQETYLGRVQSNDVQVEDPKVSRQHARIVLNERLVLLEDLHTTNGTFLNGQQVTSGAPLKDGDSLTLGDTTLRVGIRMPEVASAAVGETRVFQGPFAGEALAAVAPTTEKIIGLRNVVKKYRSADTEITILKGINLDIYQGEFAALLGPSGCGKTTTLNVIIGIDKPDAGEVTVGDQRVDKLGVNDMARWRGKNIGVVFQFFQLLPTLTAIENVMLPMHFTKTYKKSDRRERAMHCLELVGLPERANRLPSALSGGQQQRVAVARALACDPSILVADEPTGNLDSTASQQIFALLNELNSAGKTIVMVTHDPVLARSIPRRIEMLDGEIVG